MHLDFDGPFLGKMWLVIVDAHSKYPLVSATNIGSTACNSVISVLTQIFAREGLPVTIVTDEVPQFTMKEFDDFCTILAICHIVSPFFHPAS